MPTASISDEIVLKQLEIFLKDSEEKDCLAGIYLMFLKRIIENLGNGYYSEMHESRRREILSDDLKRVGFYDLAQKVEGYERRIYPF